MYYPTLKVKQNGVPVLSKNDINIIGENYVRDFQPGVLTAPGPVDIESFIECYLGMTPDYQYLSHNGIYLGMTVFNDTDRVVIFSPESNRAEYISAKAHTCIIDPRLLESNQSHRYRFTLGHEGGHDILHTGYYSFNPDQVTMFDDPPEPMIKCRVDNTSTGRKDPKLWDDHDTMEWQANYLSSAILMPESAVKLVAGRHKERIIGLRDIAIANDVAATFNVSLEAASYRLVDLGLIRQAVVSSAPIEDYII